MGKWERRKLTELAEYLNGYAFAPDDWGAEGLPIIRIEQLKNPNAPADFYAGKLPEKNIIEDGDLIFSWSASLFLRIWKNGRAALNQHLFKVVEKPGVNREFLKSFIEFYLPELTKASHGSTMQHITRKELEKFSAQFPIDETEQEKIADVIAALDRAIEQTEALIAKQQRIKTGLMQDLLTKGVDAHGNIRSEAAHAFKDSPLGRIPVEWDVSPAEKLCEAVIDCKNRTPPEAPDGHSVIRTPNVRNGEFVWTDLTFTDSKSYEIWTARGRPRTGDVVITREAPFGEACIIPNQLYAPCLGQRMMMYQPDPRKIRADYLVAAIYSQRVQKRLLELAGGSTVGHIRVGDIRTLPIPHPVNVKEQESIASVLNGISDGLKDTSNNLGKIYALKRGLMHDLLTGNRRVTELLEPKPE
jgi:type I restriction enzyme S subunit